MVNVIKRMWHISIRIRKGSRLGKMRPGIPELAFDPWEIHILKLMNTIMDVSVTKAASRIKYRKCSNFDAWTLQ